MHNDMYRLTASMLIHQYMLYRHTSIDYTFQIHAVIDRNIIIISVLMHTIKIKHTYGLCMPMHVKDYNSTAYDIIVLVDRYVYKCIHV